MNERYAWTGLNAGGEEIVLRFGPDTGPVAIVALPLFEEANRTRAFAIAICRALAKRGIASALPDFPTTGESAHRPGTVSILTIQEAYDGLVVHIGAATGRPSYGIGIRSGAMLDALGLLFGRWHFAPQNGPELLRELSRIKQIEVGHSLGDHWFFGGSSTEDEGDLTVTIAGNEVSTLLLTDLIVKTPFDEPGIPRRVVRLLSDRAPADRKIDAAPLWRRAEPDNDPALAMTLADDIADWITSCEA